MNYMRIMVLYKNTLGSVKLLIADIYIERVLESWSFIIAYPITLY